MVNQPQLHPVGSFAERHPANSPHGDFSQTFPQTTETSNNSILSGERGCFTDKRELRLPDKRGLGFPGQMRTGVLQTRRRFDVKNSKTKVGTGHPHHIETEPVHGGFDHWKNGNHSAVSWQGQVSVDVSVM